MHTGGGCVHQSDLGDTGVPTYNASQDRPQAAVWIWAHCALCWLSGGQHTQDLLWEATRTGSSWLSTALRLPRLKALRKRQSGAWYHHLGNLGDTYGDSVSFLLPSGRLLEDEDQGHQSRTCKMFLPEELSIFDIHLKCPARYLSQQQKKNDLSFELNSIL